MTLRFFLFILPAMISLQAFAQGASHSKFIIVDQFGYLPDMPKIAVLKDPQVGFDADLSFNPGSSYALVNEATGDHVFSAAPVAWKGGGNRCLLRRLQYSGVRQWRP